MSKHHRVITHHWNNGQLVRSERMVHDFDMAMFLASTSDGDTKVYDEEGNLVHSANSTQDTYA